MLSNQFDRIVAVPGRNPSRPAILRLLARYGAAAIEHDARAPDLPAAAEPLLLHSAAAAAAARHRTGRPTAHLPFCLRREFTDEHLAPRQRHQARARIGAEPTEILLATFGHLHPGKAPIDCIWALDLLRAWGINARLHFVAPPPTDPAPLASLIDDLGLAASVSLNPTHTEQAYQDHLIAADIALHLALDETREPSSAFADCLAAGLPTVTSAWLAEEMQAPEYVRSVPNRPSPVLIAEAAAALLDQPPNPQARHAYARSRGLGHYAAALCAALGLP